MLNKTKGRGLRALLGAALVAGVALAAPAAANAAPANIDPDAPVSLTITKMSSPTEEYPDIDYGDGSEVPDAAAKFELTPLEGVTFGIQKVETYNGQAVDLTKTEGWDAIGGVMKDGETFDVASATLGASSDLVTNTAGVAHWSKADGNLEIGAYWVTELGAGENVVVEPVKPFLVTVPAPSAVDVGTWLYDVYAYPKNVLMTASKTVDDSSATAIGDVLNWEITASLPAAPYSGVMLKKVEFNDKLPTEVAYEWASGAHDAVKVILSTPSNPTEALTEGTHYVVSYDKSSHTLKMVLTDAGRAYATEVMGGQGADIKMQYPTKVVNLGPEGVIKNDAVVIVNDADIAVEDQTYFGPLRLVKFTDKVTKPETGGDDQAYYDKLKAEKKLLADGEFQVFTSEELALAAGQAVKNGNAPVGAVAVEPLGGGAAQTTFVSDDGGIVDIPGLKTAPEGVVYWVVETKAPAGYYASHDPISVTVFPAEKHSTTGAYFVVNTQNPPLDLPITGSSMQTVMIAGGIALMLAGGGVALMIRRKRANGMSV